jgi:hypothetical protein
MAGRPDLVKVDLEKSFPNLTPAQIWTIVKIAKYVRLRCRSNTAFNNFFNAIIPYAKFRQIEKTNSKTGEIFMGLSIVVEGHEFVEESPETEE